MVHIVEHWEPVHPANLAPPTNHSYMTACDGTVRQQFLLSGSNSSFLIQSYEGLCLDGIACPSSDGCYPLEFVACDDSKPSLHFHRDAKHAGALVTHEGKCLDVFGGAGAGQGAKVGIYRCDGGGNQQWTSTPADTLVVNMHNDEDPSCLSTTPTSTHMGRRTIHVYSDAPFVELVVNGKSQGTRALRTAVLGGDSWGQWENIEFTPGSLIAVARATNDTSTHSALATTTVHTSGRPVALQLTIDCPSPLTGTGSALVLDMQDSGLLRAAIVDAKGTVVHHANHTVRFRVVSGPGRIVGVHNGDPQSHEPTTSTAHSAYHGLVRAAVQVTSAAALPKDALVFMRHVDVHADYTNDEATPIVVEASADGLPPVKVSIPTSLDAGNDSVLAAAEQYGRASVLGFK